MIKKIALITILTTALFGGVKGQSVDDFSRASNNDGSVGSPALRNMAGQSGSGSWKVNTDSTASPYNSGGAGTYGAMYAYTALTGSNGVEISFVIKARSSNNNTGDIAIGLANDTNLTTADGYFTRVVEISGSDRLDVRSFSNNNFPTGGGSGSGATVSLEYAVGDTIKFIYYPDGRKTAMRKTPAGAIDSCSTTLSAFNLNGTVYAILHGMMYTAPEFKIDHFYAGAFGTPAPPGADGTPPVSGDPITNPANVTAGSPFSVYSDITENIALSQAIMDSSATGSAPWNNISTQNYTAVSQTRSTRLTTPNITYASPDSVWIRTIAIDTAGNRDTSNITKVVISAVAPPDSSPYVKRSVAYLYCASTEISVPGASGQMPTDSLMWENYTHATIFAPAVNASGTAFSNDAKYHPYLTAFPPLAHANGVKIGFTIGGDGGSTNVLSAMANNPAGFATFLKSKIVQYGMDFIDFDLEGGTAPYNFTQTNYINIARPFFQAFYDTLATINAGWNPSYRPTIVLTISPGYTASWGTVLLPSEPYLDFVMLMSYDKGSMWANTILPDQVTITRDASNAIILRSFAGNTGQEFPSLEASAYMLTGTGFPASKVVVGFDFMGFVATGGTYPTDTIMYPFRPYTTAPSVVDNAYPFYSFYTTYNTSIAPRITFHPVGKFYWSYLDPGAGPTGDYFYNFGAYPGGYDSSIYYSFDLVNRRGLGGVMWWDIGESWVRTGTDKNWAQRAIKKYISMLKDSTKQTLAPPSLTSPANGATGVATNPTLDWSEVAGSTEFWVQVSTSSSFTTLTVSDSNFTISQRAISGLTNGLTYWWRVATQNANGWGSFSAPFSFTVVPSIPGTPVLVSPANGATGQNSILSLTWNPVAGATTYRVELDSIDNTFTHLAVGTQSGIATTSHQVNLRNNATYYWRVRATNSAGDGSYSASRSFTTSAGAPPVPVMSAPANGSGSLDTNNLPILWGASSGAIGYRLKVSTSPSFASVFKDTVTASTSYIAWGLTGNTTYYWKVTARNVANPTTVNDSSAYSTPWSFTTTLPGTNIFPKVNGQFLMHFSMLANTWIFNQPLSYFAMLRTTLNGSAIPEPPDTLYDHIFIGGRKQKGGAVIPWGGSSASAKMGAQEIWDSLKALGVLTGAKFQSPTIIKDLVMKSADTAFGATTVSPGRSDVSVSTALPAYSGMMPAKDNLAEYIAVGSLSSQAPMPFNPSGGMGTNPADAISSGKSGYAWIDPATGLLNYRPQVPYGDLSGVPGGGGSGGGGFEDPDTVYTFFEDFPNGGLGSTSVNDNIAGDGTPLTTRQIGTHGWRGYGFGTGATMAVRLSTISPASVNDWGIISLEADTAVTLGTARGGYITQNGGASVYTIPLMKSGEIFKARIFTPTTIDSLGWAIGVLRRNMSTPASSQSFTTEEGIWFEFGKAPYTTNDTLYAVVAGAGDVITRYALQTVSTGTFYKLQYTVGASSIAFYVNGVLKATATSNLPASTDFGSPMVGIWSYDKLAIGGGKKLGVDNILIRATGISR